MPSWKDAGALATRSGGTGFTAYGAGDLLYGMAGGPDGLARLAMASARQILSTDGSAPVWDPQLYTDIAFNSANFSGSGSMTVTTTSPDQMRYSYVRLGRRLAVRFGIKDITIGGTPSTVIQIAIPLGLVAADRIDMPILTRDNGTYGSGWAVVDPAGTVIKCFRDPAGSTWSASTNLSGVFGEIEIDTTT